MPTVVTVQVLLAEDKASSMNAICRVMTLAMGLALNGIIGWDCKPPLEVDDVEAYELEESRAGYITDLASAARRH
jgi:hypothetical protein